MKTMSAAFALIAVVAVAGGGTSIAQGGSAETEIVELNVGCGLPTNPPCLYSGYIESPKKKCLANRKVKLFALFSGNPSQELVDIARTSQDGGFGGRGISGDVSAAKAKVLKKKVDGTTCKPDTFEGA